MALPWLSKFWEPDSGSSQQRNLEWVCPEEQGTVPKGLVLIFSFPFHYMRVKDRRDDWVVWWTCTTSRECQSKYLAVSPVTDNLSSWSRKTTEDPNIPTSEVKFEGWTRVEETMVFMPYLSPFEENVLQSVRKNWHYAKIALNSTSQICIKVIRVIPLSVHIVSLARSIFNGIWPTLLQIFLFVADCSDDEWVSLRVFESATNMFSPVAHEDDGDSMKNKFPLLYSFEASLELCNL